MSSAADLFAGDEYLWSELVCDRGYADDACVQLLRLRGRVEIARRLRESEEPEAWAHALVALGDLRTLPLLLGVIDDELEGSRSWDAVDVVLDGIAGFGRTVAVSTLARLMAHREVQMRFRAAEKLASLDDAETPLRWLAFGRAVDVRVAASWGLVQLGIEGPALRYLRTHGPLLVPRFVGLGTRGVRALCQCTPKLFRRGGGLEEAAAILASKRQYERLLTNLTAEGSKLAHLALAHMDARAPGRRVAARWLAVCYGDDPLTQVEIDDLEEAGIDLSLLDEADEVLAPKTPTPRDVAHDDPLWRPPPETPEQALIRKEEDPTT